MLNDQRKKQIALIAVVVLGMALFAWWASAGYPTEQQICKPPPEDYDCTSYNILFAFAVRSFDIFNYYGTAVATGVIAWFTIVLARVGRKADTHFQVVERAYVKLSHHPPGIYWQNPGLHVPEENREYWVRIGFRVKNLGKPPAHVTEICLAYKPVGKGEKLPDVPNYSEGTIGPAHAFLVTEDEFSHLTRVKIAIEDKESIWKGDKRLFVFGYVEYRDKFGANHRGRYARRYEHGPEAPTPINIHTGEKLRRDEGVISIPNRAFVYQIRYNSDIPQRTDGTGPEA